MQFKTAGIDCSQHHIAQTRLPYQTGVGLFSGTGGEHESQSVDKHCKVRGTQGAQAERKMLRMREDYICRLSLSSNILQNEVDHLESIQPMRSPVRFRHLSPYPHKSVVMAQVIGSATSWKTQKNDQNVAGASRFFYPRFRATVCRLNNKCQERIGRLSVPRGGVNRAPAKRRYVDVASQLGTIRTL